MTTPKFAPKTAAQAAEYLRQSNLTGTTAWRALCLKLQRTARGIPPLFPSAVSAAMGTPESERVPSIRLLKRGMVAYWDDPSDSNPFGHVAFIAGRADPNTLFADLSNVLVWSNDVVPGKPGAVGLVRGDFFQRNWGDEFQFGATWLNGYDFKEFQEKPKPAILGDRYKTAIEIIEKVIAHQEVLGHDRLVEALKKDLAIMKRRYKHHQGS